MDGTRLLRRIRAFAISAASLSLFAALVISTDTHAATTYNRADITKKAMLQGLNFCVKNNSHFIKKFKSIDEYRGTIANTGGWAPNNVPLPSGASLFYHGDADAMIDCDDVFGGDSLSKVSDVFTVAGHPRPSASASSTVKKDWLIKYGGYREKASDDGSSQAFDKTTCFKLAYNLTINADGQSSTQSVKTDFFCLNLNSKGVVVSGYIEGDNQGWQNSAKGVHTALGNKDDDVTYNPSKGAFGIRHEYLIQNGAYWTASLEYAKVKGETYETAVANIKQAMVAAELGPKADKSSVPCFSSDYPRAASYTCQKYVPNAYKHNKLNYQVSIGQEVDKKDVAKAASPTNFYYVNGQEMTVQDEVGDPFRAVAYLLGYSGDPPGKIMPDKNGDGDDSIVAYAKRRMYLSQSEKIQVYMDYLDQPDLYDAQVNCNMASEDIADADRIYWYKNGEKKPTPNCAVAHKNESIKRELNALNYKAGTNAGSPIWGFEGKIGYDALVAFFKDPNNLVTLDFSADSSDYANADPTDPEAVNKRSEEAKNKDVTCYDTAGSSNWIACPIIDNSSIATKTLYRYIENMIQVNTELFTTGKSTSGTYSAWESFRNIANITFIIVFIIVILSQITGFGVDNYGIKKILPKLILGALLVNVSFYICQACIDVANITGGGIKGLLQSAANSIKGTKELQFQFNKMNAVKVGTEFTVATIAIAITAAAVYVSGGAVLVPLLLCAVGVAIGLVFFLVLLAVRQGLAVILVVISPMAFVAYMLPNTKTLFSKWLKFFSGTLLAYPICSLVLYGGELTSRIMLVAASNPDSGTITNFGLSVTSAILSVAPVFFIPTMITKSMGGIAAISGRLKNGLTTMAKGATQRSGLAQGIEENAKGIKYRRAGKWIRNHQGENAPITGIGRAKMRRSMAAVDAYERESAKMYETQAAGLGLDGLREMAVSAFDANGRLDAEKFNAAFESAYSKDPEQAWKLFEGFTNAKGEDGKNIYENLKKNDPTGFAKMNNTLARNGGVIGKAILKENNAPGTTQLQTLSSLFSTGRIASRIHNMGEDVVSSMTKDDFKVIGEMSGGNVDDYFTDTQLQRGMAASMSGSDNEAFREKIIGKLSAATAQRVITGMTVEEWANTENEKLKALYTQAFTSTTAGGKVGTTGATFGSYEDFNKMKARELMNSGNTELANKLRSDQMKAWNAVVGSRGTFSGGAGI